MYICIYIYIYIVLHWRYINWMLLQSVSQRRFWTRRFSTESRRQTKPIFYSFGVRFARVSLLIFQNLLSETTCWWKADYRFPF